MLRTAIDQQVGYVIQGNSSAASACLGRLAEQAQPARAATAVMLLNTSAVEPSPDQRALQLLALSLRCPRRHAARGLMSGVLEADKSIGRPPDRAGLQLRPAAAAFGQAEIARRRPDISIVGDELHPMGRVKDFMPLRLEDPCQWRAGGGHRQLGQ